MGRRGRDTRPAVGDAMVSYISLIQDSCGPEMHVCSWNKYEKNGLAEPRATLTGLIVMSCCVSLEQNQP